MKLKYTFRDWLYGNCSHRKLWVVFMGLAYVALLLFISHIELIHGLVSGKVIITPEAPHPFIIHHARFSVMLTNFGMLFMLFLDLYMTNRIDNPGAITFINIIGVISTIIAYGCAAGCAVDDHIVQTLGLFAIPLGTVIAWSCFVITLICLKYISLKPEK